MLLLRYCQYGNCRAAKTKGKKQPPLFWMAPGRNRCVLLMNNSASSFLLILRIILFGKKTKKWHTKRPARLCRSCLLENSRDLMVDYGILCGDLMVYVMMTKKPSVIIRSLFDLLKVFG